MAELPQAETHTAEGREPATRKPDDRKSEARNTGPSDQINGETAGLFPAAAEAALPSNGFMPALAISRPPLEAMAMLQRRLHESVTTANQGWAGFLQRRLDEHVVLSQHLMSCRTPEDIYRVNATYMQKATDEYLAQVERTLMIGRRVVNDVFAALTRTCEDAGRDGSAQGR